MWYKLTGQTRYGAYFSVFGALITIAANLLLIPKMGYMGAAWATLICYASMMIASYVSGQRNYPVPYETKRILIYVLFALALFFVSKAIDVYFDPGTVLQLTINTLLLGGYLFTLSRYERPPVSV